MFKERFDTSFATVLFGVHTNDKTYTTLAQRFSATPAAEYSAQESQIDKFLSGSLMVDGYKASERSV